MNWTWNGLGWNQCNCLGKWKVDQSTPWIYRWDGNKARILKAEEQNEHHSYINQDESWNSRLNEQTLDLSLED